MHPAAQEGVAGIVGREPELNVLEEFVVGAANGAALVLKGSPGVGKTTLWQAGRDAALGHGVRVLSAMPNSAETSLSFAGLADLLDGIEPEALGGLSAPLRRGLEVALLRADPAGEPAAPRALAFGLLNLLRQLAANRPLLVAVDDLQWLDQPTAEMLAFAVRRLHGPSVRFLFAARGGPSSPVERALAQAGPQILEVGPLSIGAMRRMLSDRLGLALPRYVLRQVFETTLGYPLFALEVGRTLGERGVPALGQDLPVPVAHADVTVLALAVNERIGLALFHQVEDFRAEEVALTIHSERGARWCIRRGRGGERRGRQAGPRCRKEASAS